MFHEDLIGYFDNVFIFALLLHPVSICVPGYMLMGIVDSVIHVHGSQPLKSAEIDVDDWCRDCAKVKKTRFI